MLDFFQSTGKKAKGIFYGWWIVISGCVMQALHSGLFGQSFTIYFLPLMDEFGWSRTLLAAGFSLSNIVNGILAPFEGWLADRFGGRRLVLIGMVLFGIGFLCLSSVHSIVTFFLSFALIAAGASLGGYLPISIVVLNWFVRKRSIALGIASAGHGVGGLLVMVVAWSMVANGWRPTAFASGIAFLVIGTLCSLVLRHRPEKYGLLPDGDKPFNKQTNTSESADIIEDTEGFTVKEALRTKTFWLISAGHASAVLTISAVSVHLAPHLVQRLDMSLESAGSIMSLLLFMSILGRLAGGFFADRIDKRWLLVGSMLSHTVGLLFLANASSMFHVVCFTIFHGIAWGARGLIQNSIRAEYFGRKAIGAILGIGSIPVVLSIIVSPIFTAWLADLNGDYHFAFMILSAYTAFGTIFFGLAKKPELKS